LGIPVEVIMAIRRGGPMPEWRTYYYVDFPSSILTGEISYGFDKFLNEGTGSRLLSKLAREFGCDSWDFWAGALALPYAVIGVSQWVAIVWIWRWYWKRRNVRKLVEADRRGLPPSSSIWTTRAKAVLVVVGICAVGWYGFPEKDAFRIEVAALQYQLDHFKEAEPYCYDAFNTHFVASQVFDTPEGERFSGDRVLAQLQLTHPHVKSASELDTRGTNLWRSLEHLRTSLGQTGVVYVACVREFGPTTADVSASYLMGPVAMQGWGFKLRRVWRRWRVVDAKCCGGA
jgi:hypothetical protein